MRRSSAWRRSRSHTPTRRQRWRGWRRSSPRRRGPAAGTDLRRHRRKGPREEPTGVGSDVGVTGDQVRGQRQFGLRPTGQVDPTGPDTRIVPSDSLLGLAVDLDVAGVQVDGRVAQHQRCPDLRGHHAEPAGVDLGQGGLDPGQLRRPESTREPGGGPARRDWRFGQQRAAGIGPDPVHPVQAVLSGQLRGRHPHKQLPAAQAPVTRLDRADTPVEDLHDAQPTDELIDRSQPASPVSVRSGSPIPTRRAQRFAERSRRRSFFTEQVPFWWVRIRSSQPQFSLPDRASAASTRPPTQRYWRISV
jgi:hypothetical protein